MRLDEIITKSPSQYGSGQNSRAERVTAPNTVQPRGFTNPSFVKKAIDKRYDRTKAIRSLTTAKEKFAFLMDPKTATTTEKISLRLPGETTAVKINSYDPSTGVIEFQRQKFGTTNVYQTNANDLIYQGAQRTSTSSPRTHIFTVDNSVHVDTIEKSLTPSLGRPKKKEKEYKFPNNPW